MAVVMSTTKTIKPSSAVDSAKLKQQLSPEQLKNAKSMYYRIRKSFYDNGVPLTRKDIEIVELIRLKILDTLLVEEF